MTENIIDNALLKTFIENVWSKVPHLEENNGDKSGKITNPTPLVDLSNDLKECARKLYNIDLEIDMKVFGKFDSNLLTGSIKIRPAVHIIHDAIITGKLKGGQTIIEATSGNFGIALGQITKIGLTVISLVSRKLQEGVFEELRNENIRIIDLDMDICPAPGMKDSADTLAAKAASSNIRTKLIDLGFDPVIFDKAHQEIESLLVDQDVINLAKLLAKIYGFFCPEQYDNELNINVHKTVTAAEINQQLHELNDSLIDYRVVCAFGTGGTSGGLSKYISEKYGKKSVHVVFPPAGQDVAGIRTKNKASGLKLYRPETFEREHEIDFEKARPLLKFFVEKGYDIGESTALALYAVMQMLYNVNNDIDKNYGKKFVVIVADGIEKYKKRLEEEISMSQNKTQVSLEEATSHVNEYDKIIWVHTRYTPRDEGIKVIAKSLGVNESMISIPKASTVEQLLQTQQIPEELNKYLQGSKGKSLLICMAGNTSLMTAKVLANKGIITESLSGGITELPEGKNKNPSELIKEAIE